jgi:hypothetical protein
MKELIKLKYMNQKISRQMLPKIKAPKFKVASKFILNEYELRCLMLEVAKGNLQSGISVMDMQSKQKGVIREDGAISNDIGDSLRMNAHFMRELYEMPKISKENIIKLESLEINTKYALGTMDIKNQKRKI